MTPHPQQELYPHEQIIQSIRNYPALWLVYVELVVIIFVIFLFYIQLDHANRVLDHIIRKIEERS